ncbi:MFS transporter [Streptomyces thermodiastaticus]
MLLVTRFLYGLAYAGFWAVAAVTAISLVTPDRTARASGVVVSGLSVAMVAGGPAGALLSHFTSWRGGFRAVVALTAVGVLATGVAVLATRAAQAPSVRARTAHLEAATAVGGVRGDPAWGRPSEIRPPSTSSRNRRMMAITAAARARRWLGPGNVCCRFRNAVGTVSSRFAVQAPAGAPYSPRTRPGCLPPPQPSTVVQLVLNARDFSTITEDHKAVVGALVGDPACDTVGVMGASPADRFAVAVRSRRGVGRPDGKHPDRGDSRPSAVPPDRPRPPAGPEHRPGFPHGSVRPVSHGRRLGRTPPAPGPPKGGVRRRFSV